MESLEDLNEEQQMNFNAASSSPTNRLGQK